MTSAVEIISGRRGGDTGLGQQLSLLSRVAPAHLLSVEVAALPSPKHRRREAPGRRAHPEHTRDAHGGRCSARPRPAHHASGASGPGPREATSRPGGNPPGACGAGGRHLPSGVEHCCSQARPNTWSTLSPWRTTSRLLLTMAACGGKSAGGQRRRAPHAPAGPSGSGAPPPGRGADAALHQRRRDEGGLRTAGHGARSLLLPGH